MVRNLGAVPPKNSAAVNIEISAHFRFRQLRNLIANISGTKQDIVKRKTALQTAISPSHEHLHSVNLDPHIANKKLSYCWETVRREGMPSIAEMDVEMTT